MKTWLRFLALPMLLMAPACGDDDPTPESACNDLDKIACKRTLECYSEAELMQAGISNEADCIRVRETSRNGLKCADFTEINSNCPTGEKYNATKASSCVGIMSKLSCPDFLANPSPGDCDLICEAIPE